VVTAAVAADMAVAVVAAEMAAAVVTAAARAAHAAAVRVKVAAARGAPGNSALRVNHQLSSV
jgi:hypothetical protein